jgi:pimeloyl-ACP methyl ester carboxylesterase
VLLHGLTEDGATWPDLVARWASDRQLLGVDLRGHGDSPRFTEDQLATSAAVMVADVVAIVDAGAGPVVLVGHSLGALFALRGALERPDRVAALVLEDPPRPDGSGLGRADLAEYAEHFLDTMLDPQPEIERTRRETTWSEEEIQAWAESKPKVDRAYIRTGVPLGDQTWKELIEAVRVPTLLLVPEPVGDDALPLPVVDNAVVQVVSIPGVDHCMRRDDPAAYHAVVDPFVTAALQARTFE